MSKAKISDVRQGVTLYYVHAFPHKGMPSYINKVVVTKRPVRRLSGALFGEVLEYFDDDLGTGSYSRIFSLRNAGIIQNRYNFHSTFTSLKAAKRYAERMDRVCLNAAERVKYNRKIAESNDPFY